MCWKINDGISILVEMQNKSMSVRGWVRMMKDEPEVLEPFSIRGFFVVVVFVCDDALFLMRPLCFMLSFLIRLPAYPNVRAEPQSDIGRNRGKKKEPFSIRAVRAEVFNELQEMRVGWRLGPKGFTSSEEHYAQLPDPTHCDELQEHLRMSRRC